MVFVELGDILCYSSKGLIGKAIKYFTRGYRETPTDITHCGIFVNEGGIKNVNIVEAIAGKGVTYRQFFSAYKDDLSNCFVLKPFNLTHSQRMTITKEAFKYIGSPYGYMKIAVQAVDGTLAKLLKKKRIVFAERIFTSEKFPICSFLVAHCYKAVGLDFGLKDDYATPDDIWDFACNNPKLYEIIRLGNENEK